MGTPWSSRSFITGLAVGGALLGAGFLLGRSSREAPAPAPRASVAEAEESAEPPPAATPPPHRRPDTYVTIALTATPARAVANVGFQIVVLDEHPARAEPNADAPVINVIRHGTTLRVVERRGDYSLVARPSDATVALGWIVWRPGAGPMGTAMLRGSVELAGRPPEMKVPKKRKDAEFCKTRDVLDDAVVSSDGKLQDVLVRLANDSFKGDYRPPAQHAEIRQVDCMYTPRIQGVVAGQTIDIANADGTLHNVHTYKGVESWFNKPQIKGSPPISQEMPDQPGVIRFGCDVHPWMRGFVVVSAHPFFAVSGADGAFAIEGLPPGKFTVEAWHSHYGRKTARVQVEHGQVTEVRFRYDGSEPEPPENKDELKDLF